MDVTRNILCDISNEQLILYGLVKWIKKTLLKIAYAWTSARRRKRADFNMETPILEAMRDTLKRTQ